MAYERIEQETHITIDETDLSWNVYTRQGRVMTKLRNIGVEPYKTEEEDGRIIGAYYKLDYKQIGFRKIREYTDEEREILRQRAHQNLGQNSPVNSDSEEDDLE